MPQVEVWGAFLWVLEHFKGFVRCPQVNESVQVTFFLGHVHMMDFSVYKIRGRNVRLTLGILLQICSLIRCELYLD